MSKRAAGFAAVAVVALLPFAAQAAGPAYKDVAKNYADIAHAAYQDATNGAKALKKAVDALVANPTEDNLTKAREAWKAARVPYMQTEAFRFGNPIVDEWEGKVNAWPLDEGLIDYVDEGYAGGESNPYAKANVIANPKITAGGKTIDATKITKELLADKLHEAGKVEANVATGYHAVEFLLWGQDLHGTGPGAGERPYTDYDLKNCTHGNCDRRAEYLKSASDLLVSDLQDMVNNWKEDGAARKNLIDGEPNAGISAILTGMGSLSYGELAGERMKLGLLLHDPEEEHDCFSDNTYMSHLEDAAGIREAIASLPDQQARADALALRDGKRHSLLGVNKVPRQQAMEITGAALCAASRSAPCSSRIWARARARASSTSRTEVCGRRGRPEAAPGPPRSSRAMSSTMTRWRTPT